MTDEVTKDDDQFQTNPGGTSPMQNITEDEKLPNEDSPPFSQPSGAQDPTADIAPAASM